MSTSAKGTTPTSFELAPLTARVTSVKGTNHHLLGECVYKGGQCIAMIGLASNKTVKLKGHLDTINQHFKRVG